MPPRKLFCALASASVLTLAAACEPPGAVQKDLWMQLNNESRDTVHFGFDPGTMFSSSSLGPGRSSARFQSQEVLPEDEYHQVTGHVGKNGAVLASAEQSMKIKNDLEQVVYIFTWDGQRLVPARTR